MTTPTRMVLGGYIMLALLTVAVVWVAHLTFSPVRHMRRPTDAEGNALSDPGGLSPTGVLFGAYIRV